MITVPTAPEVHVVFDGIAWVSGLGLSALLYRWRLRSAVAQVAARTGPGYFASLACGAALGTWAAGSLNTLRDAVPVLSHSIAGALAGRLSPSKHTRRFAACAARPAASTWDRSAWES